MEKRTSKWQKESQRTCGQTCRNYSVGRREGKRKRRECWTEHERDERTNASGGLVLWYAQLLLETVAAQSRVPVWVPISTFPIQRLATNAPSKTEEDGPSDWASCLPCGRPGSLLLISAWPGPRCWCSHSEHEPVDERKVSLSPAMSLRQI